MIEAIAVAFLIIQVWLSERTVRAAAALLRETVAVRHLVLVEPQAAVERVCSNGTSAVAWCRLRLVVREHDVWRSVCEVEEPVVRGIDRYYALEGRCDFPFPFGLSHPLRLREIVRR